MRGELRYHVPRSQVWQSSRGKQSGNVHIHVLDHYFYGRLERQPGEALCSKKNGWYEREATNTEKMNDSCPECHKRANRPGSPLVFVTDPSR